MLALSVGGCVLLVALAMFAIGGTSTFAKPTPLARMGVALLPASVVVALIGSSALYNAPATVRQGLTWARPNATFPTVDHWLNRWEAGRTGDLTSAHVMYTAVFLLIVLIATRVFHHAVVTLRLLKFARRIQATGAAQSTR
jgi:hypothetical protein